MHRDGVRGQQEHAPRLQVQPVGDSPGSTSAGRAWPPGAPARTRTTPRAGHAGSPVRTPAGSRSAGARPPPPGWPRRPGPRRTRTSRPGNAAPCSSGCPLQARCDPGDPGCLPGFRFPAPPAGFRRGGVRPGRSSADGGIEELPLLRDASRSSRSTRAARSATCPASRAFSAASNSITRACTAITAPRAASTGIEGTDHHDQDTHVRIKPTRCGHLLRSTVEIHRPAASRSATASHLVPASAKRSAEPNHHMPERLVGQPAPVASRIPHHA